MNIYLLFPFIFVLSIFIHAFVFAKFYQVLKRNEFNESLLLKLKQRDEERKLYSINRYEEKYRELYGYPNRNDVVYEKDVD